MEYKEIIKLINDKIIEAENETEIGEEISEDYLNGYINGLNHAIIIIKELGIK